MKQLCFNVLILSRIGVVERRLLHCVRNDHCDSSFKAGGGLIGGYAANQPSPC